MTYKFTCRHCGSRFSLQQQLDDHEEACGAVGGKQPEKKANKAAPKIPCKFCPETFANLGEYGKHRWAAHREQVLAVLAERKAQQKKKEGKIDGPSSSRLSVRGRPARGSIDSPKKGIHPLAEPACPTCGGALPATTAQLVSELVAAGIPESKALEAARIARRVLGSGNGAH